MTSTKSSAAENYNMYGFRQEEFSYLPDWAKEEVVEYCHAMANLFNFARGLEVVRTCTDGFRITRAMVEQEIRETKRSRPAPFGLKGFPRVVGLNASSNMFA